MNPEKFSQAISEIGDKYLEEAINYKPKKKISPLYKKVSAFAAVFVFIAISLSAALLLKPDSVKVYMNDSKVTGKTMAVAGAQRGISLASENEDLMLLLRIEAKDGAQIFVSGGEIAETVSDVSNKGEDVISVSSSSTVYWSLPGAVKGDIFTMKISSSENETVLKLEFSTEKNSWVISKIRPANYGGKKQ